MAGRSGSRRSGERKTRIRFGTFPKPADLVEVPYARVREAHAGASAGEITRRILDSHAWQQVMVPVLDRIDARRGPQAEYTAHELESALLFQRVAGKRGYKEARGMLAGDMHRDARELLGFDRPRGRRTRGNPNRWRRSGVPSEATLSRYRTKFFPPDERAAAYAELVFMLRQQIAPMIGPGARMLHLDGTKIETHYTPPKINPKTGEITNATKVTAPDAGFVPNGKATSPDHAGAGWNLVALMTEDGLPIAHRLVRLNESEKEVAVGVLADYIEQIQPLLDDEVRVLTADGAFHSPRVRQTARRAGCVENIHNASHSIGEASVRNRARLSAMRFEIEGYPNWHADGFRQLHCSCGEASLTRRAHIDRNGVARTTTEGSCKTCGSITVTSGRWRQAKNPNRYVRIVPGEEPDLMFGNPLTYDDALSEIYGHRRHGNQEGTFGHTLTQRFELIKSKRWFRRKAQADADVNMVFSIMLTLAQGHYEARSAPPITLMRGGPPGRHEHAAQPLAA